MQHYEKLAIGTDEQWDSNHAAYIAEEISGINKQTAQCSGAFKELMLVSFLKNHLMQNDWVRANHALAKLIASGSLFTGSIESVFESSKDNSIFRQALENYLQRQFSAELQ